MWLEWLMITVGRCRKSIVTDSDFGGIFIDKWLFLCNIHFNVSITRTLPFPRVTTIRLRVFFNTITVTLFFYHRATVIVSPFFGLMLSNTFFFCLVFDVTISADIETYSWSLEITGFICVSLRRLRYDFYMSIFSGFFGNLTWHVFLCDKTHRRIGYLYANVI